MVEPHENRFPLKNWGLKRLFLSENLDSVVFGWPLRGNWRKSGKNKTKTTRIATSKLFSHLRLVKFGSWTFEL